MQHTTRTRLATTALLAILLPGCGRDEARPSGVDRTADDPQSSAAPTTPWRAAEVEAPGFRAFGWGAGDTLWGIERGRLAWALRDGTRGRLQPVAWDVQAAGDDVTWTNEGGLWRRGGSEPAVIVHPDDSPVADYLGPDVLWSPDGRRALLTWSGEGPAANAVLEGDTLRHLTALLPGLGGTTDAVWLDDQRVAVRVIGFGPRTGPAEHREGGYRSDLAELDVVADRIRIVTAAADGEFYAPEGMLGPAALLAGIRGTDGYPVRHVLLDARTWTPAPQSIPEGRAVAAHGAIALLRPATAAGAEPAWQLDITDGAGNATSVLELHGYAVRLLWHPDRPVLAVAQESESTAIRTWILSRE